MTIKKLVHTPDGVRDIYGTEMQRKLTLENKLKETIYSYGFSDIETPTFEYFDVFSREIGTTSSKELYKFFDNYGDTLCLRPDFTPSVARSVAKYFTDEIRPIKLTYMGNTFVNYSELQGKLKEVTQIGVELMNDASFTADAEIINLCIDSLKSIGLKNFQVSLGHMDYFKGLCESAGIDEEKEYELRELIQKKNSFSAEALLDTLHVNEKCKDLLLKTGDTTGDISVILNLKESVVNEKSKAALERLISVYETLKLYGNEEDVSFDVGMLSKYNYYTGIIFKAFTYGVGDAVVKGGRYDSLLSHFGTSKPAIGFVMVVDDLLMALRGQDISVSVKDDPEVFYFTDDNLEEKIKEAVTLRKSGKRVSLERK